MITKDVCKCSKCDMLYSAEYDAEIHTQKHNRHAAAQKLHGRLRAYDERETVKESIRKMIFDSCGDDYKLIGLFKRLFRVYFERSVQAFDCQCYEHHPTFSEYVSMLLGQDAWRKYCDSVSPTLYDELVNVYGKRTEIAEGDTYWRG